MRILIITPTIYEFPKRVGGAETYVENIAKSFAKSSQIKVGILGFSINKTGKWKNQNIDYKIYKSIPIKNNPSNPLPIFNFFEILRWDIIYIHQFHTWLAFVCIIFAKIFRKKIVLTDHNGGGPTYNRRLKIDKLIDLYLSTSKLSFKEIKLQPKKMVAIYGGADREIFTASNKLKMGLLYVGRAHKIKGIIPFLESALANSYQERITLALGVNFDNEEYYKILLDFISNTPLLNCSIKKNLSVSELVNEYQSHLWTVLPSIDEAPHESLGLTVLESMACDTPVAVSPFCGVVEMFEKSAYPFIHILFDQSVFFKTISQTPIKGAREWAIENASWEVVVKKAILEMQKI